MNITEEEATDAGSQYTLLSQLSGVDLTSSV